MKLNNKYYLLRHGEAVSNVKRVYSSWPEKFKNPLTKKGRLMIKESTERLKDKDINLIFASDLLRTKQTADIVEKKLGIKPLFNKRLREISFGIFNGKPGILWRNYFSTKEEKVINKAAPKGESYKDVLKRVFDFLKDIDKKYHNRKNQDSQHYRNRIIQKRVGHKNQYLSWQRQIRLKS